MSEPSWDQQNAKTFANFEGLTPVDPSKIGHTEEADQATLLPALTDKLRPLFGAAFSRQAHEVIDWDIAMMFYPNPQNGAVQAVLAIFAQTPGAVLGTNVSAVTMGQPTMEMEQNIEGWVRQTLETLRNGLSQQLNAMQEQPRDQGLRPPANGGLILPGN